MKLAAVLALASVTSLALGTALIAVAIRRMRRRSPEPARCSVCGELVSDHHADWRRTTWQRGGADA